MTSEDVIKMTQTPSEKSNLEKFWKKHTYLKDMWSSAMSDSWRFHKILSSNNMLFMPLYATEENWDDFNNILKLIITLGSIDCDSDLEFNAIHLKNMYVLNENDRKILSSKNEIGMECYSTKAREMLKKIFEDPRAAEMANLSYDSTLVFSQMLASIALSDHPDHKKRANVLSSNYNKVISVYSKILDLSKIGKEETDPIIKYDVIMKILEICIDNDLTTILNFIFDVKKYFNENNPDIESFIDVVKKSYHDGIKFFPELIID